jgi:hypothetical protein
MITQEYLKEILDYNPETGIFTWKIKKNGTKGINSIAGHIDKKGYFRIKINSISHKAHRLAWLYVYGNTPKGQIDHVNGVKHDNKISNLRIVSNRENCQNRIEHRQGKLVGCYYNKRDKKWQAQIQINGKQTFIGLFETQREAHAAYLKALETLRT